MIRSEAEDRSSRAARTPRPAARLGIYAHIPFCARRCDYCDFFVLIGPEGVEEFFGWLSRDLASSRSRLAADSVGVDTIYLGGGTPSYAPPEKIAGFLEECRRLFRILPGAEVTLEANPEGVSPARVRAWLGAGVSRLSLGVQSLDDAVLRPRGRLYTAEEARAAAGTARDCGVRNLSVDLIAGLPHETAAGFRRGIDRVIEEMAPEHVSVYLIETEESGKRTALARAVREERVHLPVEEEMVTMYSEAIERLGAAGYRQYEISNFSLPRRESQHNLKYWRSEACLGVGPSAHSLLDGRRHRRRASLAGWVAWVEARAKGSDRGGPADGDDYTLPDAAARAREALVLELRLTAGVGVGAFRERWDFDPEEELGAEIGMLVEAGLLERKDGRLRLTGRGVLLSNEVFCRLI